MTSESPSIFLIEGIYALGAAVSLSLWVLHRLLRVVWPSREVRIAKHNLSKIGLIWVDDSKVIVDDSTVQNRNFWLVALGVSLFSWLGVLLSVVLIWSLRTLRSPRERALFESEISKNRDLGEAEIKKLANRLKI